MRIIDIRDQLPRHPRRRYASRPLNAITHLVLHHSGTRGGTPESFARYHTWVCGWPGIGYHYVIAKDGTVYKTNALSTVSYHARGANLTSVGICLVGDFNRDEPTAEQLAALRELIALLKDYFASARVIYHRDVPTSHTTCPGAKMPEEFKNL